MNDLLVRWGKRLIASLVLTSVFWGIFIHSVFWAISPTVFFGLLGLAFCIGTFLRLFTQVSSDEKPQPSIGPSPTRLPFFKSAWIWVPVAITALFILLQITPLPVAAVKTLSPTRVVLAQKLSAGLPQLQSSALTLSLDPNASMRALPFLVFPVIAFLLGGYLASNRKRARIIVRMLLWLIFAEALYGLLEQLSGHQYILWIPDEGTDALGTFTNRNHFAATLSLFLPISIGWLYFRTTDRMATSNRDNLLPPTSWDMLNSRHSLWLFMPAILILGIIQSHSRGGFASMLFSLAIMLFAGVRSRMTRTFSAVGILLALAIFGYAINSDYQAVIDRFKDSAREYEGENGRMALWRNSLGMMADYPWFGIGPGNFADAYRHYEQGGYSSSPYQAHNEWLEGFLTFGILGMCPLVMVLIICFAKSFRSIRHAGRDKPWLLGIYCGLLGLMLHSFVEFTFHSPGIAITASFLTGLLLGFKPHTHGTAEYQNLLRINRPNFPGGTLG